MHRTCIIDTNSMSVVNVVEYEDVVTGIPPGMGDSFVALQSDDGQIGWAYDGANLIPPVTPVETPTNARVRALVDIRAQRAPILDALAGIGFDALFSGDNATSQGAYAARQSLKDITSDAAFISATTYDDMKAAIMARYQAIVAAAPASVRVAFSALLS